MNVEKPHFLARRSNARHLTCPRCPDEVVGETPFLDHAKSKHPELTADAPDGPTWKQILAEAARKSKQKTVRKPAPDPPSEMSKRSSTDSMQQNVDDTGSFSGVSHPASFGSKLQDPKLDEFKRLSLGQRSDQASASGLIPLKRSANQSGSRETKAQGDDRGYSKNRRVNASFGISQRDVAGLEREAATGPGRRLFDPHADNASLARGKLIQGNPASQARDAKSQIQRSTKESNKPGIIETSALRAVGPTVENDSFSRMDIRSLEPAEPIDEWDADPELLLQPETRPISHEQLVHEVKGIYAGLVMVEAKCIDVDGKQSAAAQDRDPTKRTQLTPEQWSALIALHKTLLHEHHDFFLASQHPSASPALTKLAEKYSMPARMWKHGIHAFLEVLRLRLPGSLDHMLAFIYIAYSMMALLYETVPSFGDTWIECLGDLGRYRMAIGDEDLKDRDVWSGVARFWYGKAADKNPQIGRLHHHLAILARPYTIQQLSLYTRSLTAVIPFEGAKTSIMSLFNPVFSEQPSTTQFKPGSVEGHLIKCLAFLYTGRTGDNYDACLHQLVNLGLFGRYIERAGSKFKEIGVFACLSVLGSLLEFASCKPKGAASRSLIRREFEDLKRRRQAEKEGSSADAPSRSGNSAEDLTIHEIELSKGNIAQACKLVFGLLSVVLRRPQDRNVQPMVHAYLAFINNLASSDAGIQLLEREIPWSLIVAYLNHFANASTITSQVTREDFPKPANDVIGRPLPEDFVLRGQIFTEGYFPETWFSDADIDDEERVLELPSMTAPRLERMLWNAHSLARYQKWISLNYETNKFEETQFVRDLPSPEMSTTIVDPSVASEVDTLVLEPAEDEKTSFNISEPVDLSESPSKGRFKSEHELQPPYNIFINKTPTVLKREQKEDIEMTDPAPVKREAIEQTERVRKSDYRPRANKETSGKKSGSMYPHSKKMDPAAGEYVKIVEDTGDPTEP